MFPNLVYPLKTIEFNLLKKSNHTLNECSISLVISRFLHEKKLYLCLFDNSGCAVIVTTKWHITLLQATPIKWQMLHRIMRACVPSIWKSIWQKKSRNQIDLKKHSVYFQFSLNQTISHTRLKSAIEEKDNNNSSSPASYF